MQSYRTEAPAPVAAQQAQPWVYVAGVAAISVGAIVGLMASSAGQTSLYTTVGQATATRPILANTQVNYRSSAAAAQYATAAPAGVYMNQAVQMPAMQAQTETSNITTTIGFSAVMILVGSVMYNFFKRPAQQALAVPATLKSVVSGARNVKLSTRQVAPNTTYAMMTTTSEKTTEKKTRGIKSPVFDETCDQTGITLSRFMLEVARANPDLVELESIFASLQTACKTIAKLVKRSAIDGSIGYQDGGGAINVQGEEQKKLDVITNDVLKKALKFTGRMGVLASEEEDTPVAIDNTVDESYGKDVVIEEGGRYISVFDPLDGSSNVDAGIPVGTIFGIFEEDGDCNLPDDYFDGTADLAEGMKECLQSTLKPGNSLVASGYALYSSATSFVFTLGDGVNGFTLDESIGEFILTHPNIKIPPRAQIYSMNEANRLNWDAPTQAFIASLADGTNRGGNKYTSRYIGSMVGDVHRTLLYGGVFGYTADTKNVNGKLRLLYEAAPMSFLIEQAGGKSTTGMVRCMDLPPKNVHQRVPLMMGGADEMDELAELYEKLADDDLKKSQMERLAF
jgi:fructose-1,6-bisphosphatase I